MSGNISDDYIHHPLLGQVPTAGLRFHAILKAAKRVRAIQQTPEHQAAVNDRLFAKQAVHMNETLVRVSRTE